MFYCTSKIKRPNKVTLYLIKYNQRSRLSKCEPIPILLKNKKIIKCKTQGADTFKNSTFLHVNVCPIFSQMLIDILNF